MTKYLALLTLVAGLAPAHADTIKPLSAQRVTLGSIEGVTYYSEEPDGFRVVTTLVEGEHGRSIRVITTLDAGQSIRISVPQSADEPELTFDLVRDGDSLILRDPLEPLTASIR